MTDGARTPAQRLQAVKTRLSIGVVIGAEVKLTGSASAGARRGPCPFHAGKSASFSVAKANSGEGYAHCFGCQWSGDMVKFLQDLKGWSFGEALADLERMAGIDPGGEMLPDRGRIQRERNPAHKPQREKVLVATIDMARAVWRRARPDHAAVRRYFIGRGVPEWVLADHRLVQFRFLGTCPLLQWEIKGPDDHKAWPRDALNAPAVVAMVRKPVMLESVTGPRLEFVPCGLHVTYLSPDGTGTMVRRKPWAKGDDPDPLFAKRKMLGPVGHGAVLLGEWTPAAPLYVGEGNETVFSGMALDDAPSDAIGVATLSLDNLQGAPLKWAGGIWPLHRIEPDPERAPFVIPVQTGPLTGLIDADMAPLGKQKVVAAKGAPIIERAISGAERAQICADLFVKGWRASGVRDVRALRAPLGMDFNDVVMGAAA